MENKIILFSKQPIISEFNKQILQIYIDDNNLCAKVNDNNEIIIPFKDEGDVDEIVCIAGYVKIDNNLYQLYNQKFYYNNNLCEGELEIYELPYLIILGNNIKLCNSINQANNYLNKILL